MTAGEKARKTRASGGIRQAAGQIALCALVLIVFCVGLRFTVFRTYTARIPIQPVRMQRLRSGEGRLDVKAEPGVLHLGDVRVHDGFLSVPVYPDRPGDADLVLLDENGEEAGFHMLRVSRLGTVFDLQSGGFNGDTAVLAAVTLFWFAVSAIMLYHYLQARGAEYYAYSTIYLSGFSLFALVTSLTLLQVTLSHIQHPADYDMLSAYSTINGASKHFMLLTMPVMVAFALAMAVSNLALLRHERFRLHNVLGLLVSLGLLAGEALGCWLFVQNFMGSEWEYRVRNTLENIYATFFVYFECMLVGSVICGISAARHRPRGEYDFIIILGCWFRRDGTLPPLLRGRVDRALAFWKQQKERTGREAILIPSGGQGPDEPMPEAEAMRRYILSQGVPETAILPETRSANTYQNMAFSKALIDGINAGGKSIFATTSYHVFRSGVWANQAGLSAEGIGGKTVWWYWPNAFMRECVGLLQRRWKQELVLLAVLMAFFGLLSMVLA